MFTLERMFLENPWPVYLIAGLAELVCVAVWQRFRTTKAKVLLVVWPLAAIATAIAAHVVVTDAEHVALTWGRIEAAITARDTEGILAHIADDFDSDGVGRTELGRMADRAFKAGADKDLTFNSFSVRDVDGDEAATRLMTTYRSPYGQSIPNTWEVTFVRGTDGLWRVAKARCIWPKGATLRDAARAANL